MTPAVGGTGTVTATIATLAAGATANFTYVVNVNSSALPGTFIVNAANVTTTTTDVNALNNADSETTLVEAVVIDFGDAPDSYGTLLASDGARHVVTSLFLGASVDAEVDGQPTADASGDGADEDGVALASSLLAGLSASATVTASADGLLDAWIDFDGSGTFDASEQIAASLPVAAGDNSVSFTVPVTAVGGTTFARFRLSTAGGLAPTGAAADGEVGDYQLNIVGVTPGSAQLVEDTNNPGQTMLLIVGTSENDHILIEPRPSNRLQIRVTNQHRLLGIFQRAQVSRIVALGLEGNDVIVVDARLAKPAELHGNEDNDKLVGGGGNDELFGEEGNDTLVGGNGHDKLHGGGGDDSLFGGNGRDMLFGKAGNDQLFGEAGNDILLGGSGNDGLRGGIGRDLLIGGEDRDRLWGQDHDDILIGGTTAHDADEAALLAILADWSAAIGFNPRIAGLSGQLNDGTVFDDGAIDELNGGLGRDWYLDFALADTFVGFKASVDRRN